MASFTLPTVATNDASWGPPTGASAALALPEEFQKIPFTPFSKVRKFR